ncbi:MAG: hypothetical protein H7Z42_05580 [Roseiflexaceae bacterium]|nr:hypothetical protein [Roseiflexaceae bacterium]
MATNAASPQINPEAYPWAESPALPIFSRYLVGMRWVLILLMSLLTLWFSSNPLFGIPVHTGRISPWLVVAAIIACNVPLSVWIWRRWLPAGGSRMHWLVASEALQAIGWTALAGGSSFFFLFFMLAIVESSVVYSWRAMLRLVLLLVTLRLLMTIPDLVQQRTTIATSLAQPMVVGMLFVGALLTILNEQVRREQHARREDAIVAARNAALNQIASQLSNSGFDVERLRAILLAGAHSFLQAEFTLILRYAEEADGAGWHVLASTTERHPVGQRVSGWNDILAEQGLTLMGAGYQLPLPAFVRNDGIDQLIGASLTAPAYTVRGALIIGRRAPQALSENEQLFVGSLVREAGIALRNARLYVLEQEQVKALQRFEAARSTFFSTVAHELKTPLTVLKTLALSQLDLPTIPPAVLAEISEATEQNLRRIETLINDLLEVTRLEAEAITLRPHALDLAMHAERFVAGMRPLVERRQRHVQLVVAGVLPLVWADAKRVDQVLVNLVNNAVKFAPPASTVEVTIAPTNHDRDVQVCVLDRGPGVPNDERARVFEKFYTKAADKALTGLGLGLFICRELVRLHGGQIWLEDRPGGGSCFCFTLPQLREDTADAES